MAMMTTISLVLLCLFFVGPPGAMVTAVLGVATFHFTVAAEDGFEEVVEDFEECVEDDEEDVEEEVEVDEDDSEDPSSEDEESEESDVEVFSVVEEMDEEEEEPEECVECEFSCEVVVVDFFEEEVEDVFMTFVWMFGIPFDFNLATLTDYVPRYP
mmetsp:Transcript_25695/g.52379  ORF Transcript_25695/g.52379 Transcript_25695/m.52379 type:complete len:156 (+) Transcript_25695:259-726(+)